MLHMLHILHMLHLPGLELFLSSGRIEKMFRLMLRKIAGKVLGSPPPPHILKKRIWGISHTGLNTKKNTHRTTTEIETVLAPLLYKKKTTKNI